MLERYLTPILFSYVDKYVKNLAPSDLRLSLWQGEVVLNNLELRLDVLESDLGLPMQLVSGKIRRLHIQVPWTSLNSEPVRVTVDTLECVMKWKDDDSDSRYETGIVCYDVHTVRHFVFALNNFIFLGHVLDQVLCFRSNLP
jgi:vacuolar protein sorting-associated protein 13B